MYSIIDVLSDYTIYYHNSLQYSHDEGVTFKISVYHTKVDLSPCYAKYKSLDWTNGSHCCTSDAHLLCCNANIVCCIRHNSKQLAVI